MAPSRFLEVELLMLVISLRFPRDIRDKKLSILGSRRSCPASLTRIVISITRVCAAKSRRNSLLRIGFAQLTRRRRNLPRTIMSRRSRKVLPRRKDLEQRQLQTLPRFQNSFHGSIHRFGRGGSRN